MQKKLIKVGEEYEVEVDGLWVPRQPLKTYGGLNVVFPHGYTTRGVSERWGTRVRATVKALDQQRPTRSSGMNTAFSDDGVLVEFPKGFTISNAGERMPVETAVLTTKHILRTWAEAEKDRIATETARENNHKRIVAEARSFAPKLTAAIAALRLAGFHVEQHEKVVRFWKDEIKGVAVVRLKVEHTYEREDFIVGWSGQDAAISRELLFDLIGVV